MTPIYWSGTSTPISRNNDFNWDTGEPSMFCRDRAHNGANQAVADGVRGRAEQSVALHKTRNPKPIRKAMP